MQVDDKKRKGLIKSEIDGFCVRLNSLGQKVCLPALSTFKLRLAETTVKLAVTENTLHCDAFIPELQAPYRWSFTLPKREGIKRTQESSFVDLESMIASFRVELNGKL